MHLYKTSEGPLLVHDGKVYQLQQDWDLLINRSALHRYLQEMTTKSTAFPIREKQQLIDRPLAPIGSQEVWAAGVTYLRSRDARMEESKDSGGADFYQKVYEAERPELFFKSLPHRVAAHNDTVNIREDSTWNVPEPELTLFISSHGTIEAYTIGNDMSSRSIEGENPLYLPQAKMYEKSAAIGPCLYVPPAPLPPETKIAITIHRSGKEQFNAGIQLNRMKRSLPELAGWLYRGCVFNTGCFLMTGTGLVPDDTFTLQEKDVVTIKIEGIGSLVNTVALLKFNERP